MTTSKSWPFTYATTGTFFIWFCAVDVTLFFFYVTNFISDKKLRVCCLDWYFSWNTMVQNGVHAENVYTTSINKSCNTNTAQLYTHQPMIVTLLTHESQWNKSSTSSPVLLTKKAAYFYSYTIPNIAFDHMFQFSVKKTEHETTKFSEH